MDLTKMKLLWQKYFGIPLDPVLCEMMQNAIVTGATFPNGEKIPLAKQGYCWKIIGNKARYQKST